MEDVLDLYAEPFDPQRPMACFDETSTQLLADLQAIGTAPAIDYYAYVRVLEINTSE